ncbi:MAG: TetR/AcrR family transcriptional regulator [Desulfosarcinaceae bacterium]|nr:TetR/AcrR family transcriptional regulator [Desulfosarcinaceae bacterium]
MTDRSTFQKLREDERETRRELIIETAMRLFRRRQVSKIGMRDIAKEAGISAAAIYRYFPSRDDILVEAIIKHIQAVEDRLEEHRLEGRSSLAELAIASVDYLMDHDSLFQMMGHFMVTGKIKPQTLTKFNTVQRYFFNLLDQINEEAGLGDRHRLYSHAFYASIVGVVMTFRNYPGRDREEIRRHVHRLTRLVSGAFLQRMATVGSAAGDTSLPLDLCPEEMADAGTLSRLKKRPIGKSGR